MKLLNIFTFKQFAFLLLLFLASLGNSTIIYTGISQDTLTIGDRVELTVSLVVPKDAQVIPPETDAGFGNFIIKNLNTEKIERKASDSIAFKYLLTTYTVEPCSIPALPYIEVKEDGNDTLYSDTIPMRIISVITANQGDTIKLKDIKPQQSAGKPSLLWLWIILGLALIAAGIFLGRYFWIKSRKPPPPPPPKPPYEEAIEALAMLENKQLITRGLLREYVFELSEILKRYMGRRFESNAAECTTEEILEWLQTAPFDAKLIKPMEWFFDYTHPVKFAKVIPEAVTVRKLYDETVSFIEKTRPTLSETQKDSPDEGEKK